MRAWFASCAALVACTHPVSVHGGNLIELDAAPGTADIVATHSSGASLTLTVPTLPWQGRVVAAVPLLPVSGGESWSLSYRPAHGKSRDATLVANSVAGAVGDAAIQFVDEVGKLDASLTPPAQAEKLAVFNRDLGDLESTVSLLEAALTQARSMPSPVGSWKGFTLNLDSTGLQFLDAAVTAAREPPVALFSPPFAGAGTSTAAFALLLDAAAVLAMPAACDYSAPVVAPTAFGADFIAEILGLQLLPALLDADRTHDAESSALVTLYGYGAVRAHAISANHVVLSNASGGIKFSAAAAARLQALSCDPAACAPGTGCLDCNALWDGCFAGGASCCGSGFWAIACESGSACAICNGIWTCLRSGAACPSFGTETVAGNGFFTEDGGTPGGDPDAGPSGPQRCGTISVAGSDTADQRLIELGKDAGSFVFDWNTYGITDDITVSYENKVVFDTGCVAAHRSNTIPFKGVSTQVTIAVTPRCNNGAAGSLWEYAVGCPP